MSGPAHLAARVHLCLAAGLLLVAGCKDDPKPAPAAAPPASAAPSASAPAVGSPIPSASVAAIVNPANLPAYAGPTGSVEGTIFIIGDAAPALSGKNFAKCPAAAQTRGHLFRAGAPVADGGGVAAKAKDGDGGPSAPRPLADAIIAVTGYSGFFVPERKEVRSLVIERCEDAPRTIDMTFGQRLEVQNKTKDLFAPAIEQVSSPALMIAPPGADPVKVYLPRPGHFSLVDRLGGDFLAADVYALLHPLHATSGVDGHYRIDGIPLGKLKVNARLAAIGRETAQDVEILSGVVQKVDLTLSYTAPKGPAPAASASKDAEAPRIIH